MNWKPKTKDELDNIIEEIINNQLSDNSYPLGLKDTQSDTSKDKDVSLVDGRNITYPYGLSDIDVSLITDMEELFSCNENDRNSEINKLIDWNDSRNDITNWNVSNVTDMFSMFTHSNFNQPIGNWNVSNVRDMSYMFMDNSFNQDISNWNVSSVTNMSWMFYSSPFNQDISNWNISNVIDMSSMFYESLFDRNLYRWIDKLNSNINLNNFNNNSIHKEIFGSINIKKEFIDNQLRPDIWINDYRNGSDRDRFELLKLLKNQDKQFIDNLKELIDNNNIDINI